MPRSAGTVLPLLFLSAYAVFAQATHPPAIASITVCTPGGSNGGSCATGSSDTHKLVLAPDGSGSAFNYYDAGATTDEHASIFSPGMLGANNDYLFVVASATSGYAGIGAVFLSGGTGPDKNGQWTLDFPRVDGYGSFRTNSGQTDYGQIFKSPFSELNCPTVADGNPAHQDQTFDLGYAAPGSVVRDPTSPAGSLLMIYEGVNSCLGSAGGPKPGTGAGANDAYISVGVATSLDYGKTWPTYRGTTSFSFVPIPGSGQAQGPGAPSGALGRNVCMGNDCTTTPPATYGRYPVLSSHTSLATLMAAGKSINGTVGDSAMSAFVDDIAATAPYIYAVYSYQPGPINDPPLPGRFSDLRIARAQLNGASSPLSFNRWNAGAFSSPGIGGVDSFILPDSASTSCGTTSQGRGEGSISYVEPTQQYLLLFVCTSPSDPQTGTGNRGSAWFYSTSYDLSDPSQWTPPREIAGSWSEHDASGGCASYKGWYPTPMSLNTRPGHLSGTGYVFYLWGCADDAISGPKRQFSSRAFTITTTAAPTILTGGIVPVYSTATTIQPGEWASVYGNNLATDPLSWKGDFPTSLGGTSVTVDGKPAYLWFVSPTQINFQVPDDATNGPVQIVIDAPGGTVSATVTLARYAPSFLVQADGKHVTAIVLTPGAPGNSGSGWDVIGPSRPVRAGEALVVYAVGLGPTKTAVPAGQPYAGATQTMNPVQVSIGGAQVPQSNVQFAGLVGAGLYQINIQVPNNLGSGEKTIVATAGGVTTQTSVILSLQ
jgi:uncharacterized protein (TIGR03437 family)